MGSSQLLFQFSEYTRYAEALHASALATITGEPLGLPDGFAEGLAAWDVDASKGALFDDGHQLSKLIGRSTTSLADAVRAQLAAQG